jgi:hypothetical protein
MSINGPTTDTRAALDAIAIKSGANLGEYTAARDRHEAMIKAEALREAAEGYWGRDGDPDYPSTSGAVRHALRARADRIESEARG